MDAHYSLEYYPSKMLKVIVVTIENHIFVRAIKNLMYGNKKITYRNQ